MTAKYQLTMMKLVECVEIEKDAELLVWTRYKSVILFILEKEMKEKNKTLIFFS